MADKPLISRGVMTGRRNGGGAGRIDTAHRYDEAAGPRSAHRLSDPQRHVRGRLTVRDAVVRTRIRSISVIRALLRHQGYRVPSGSAEAFVQRAPP